MYDSFDRHIHYLRISVTDRCNLRCTYCMPPEGVRLIHHTQVLSYEEILEIADIAVSLGFDKIRITGGEPLVRKGVAGLVRMLAGLDISDLSMTTNGTLLRQYAGSMKEAGLMRINVSLDTVDPQRYREITRGGEVRDVLDGIDAALDAGISPVKINCVVNGSTEGKDAVEVAHYAANRGLEVRYIHQMNLSKGHFAVVEGGDGGDCSRCSRLRLTANGLIKPCLFDDLAFDTRTLGAREAIRRAVEYKPAGGSINCSGHFYNIGG
ncbi:MAG TPA: radical SAM protein [Bacteroidales bacterium]|nr:radical SAM protein [Bacteroidales bacterium]HSA44129.1 radical SAM protein [Bacteroidales bacterium]